jgi:peptidoglycan/LPS O-acetylase OafA/YrhL
MQQSHAMSSPNAVIPSLDGVRAVAVALVFFAHSGLENTVPGGLGVTIFFVLSGYLISTLLRVEYATTGKIDYRGFYLRRFLRLMPPLAVIVSLTSILALLGLVDNFTPNGLLSVLFYYGNYFMIANDFAGVPAGIGIVWSLAVEEHYYLLYPPLAAILLRVGRVGLSAGILSALCALVLAWRCWLASQGVTADYIEMASDTRIDAILIGCLMALWRNPWLDPPAQSSPRRDGALVGIALAVLLFTLVYRNEFFRLTYRYTLQSGAAAMLLYVAVARSRMWPFSWLNMRPVMYIGAVSYTVYLAHHVVIRLIERHMPQWNWLAVTAMALLVTLAIAELMRRWVEQPCARLRKRLHKRTLSRGAVNEPLPQAIPGGTL